mgnify:CR=1 FL=1
MIIDKIHVLNSDTKQAEYICIDTKDILQLKTIGDSAYKLTISKDDFAQEYVINWITGCFIKQEMENTDDEC